MPVATPTLDQVFAAIVTEMSAMVPLPGTILHFENNLDDEVEFIKEHQNPTTHELHLFLLTCPAIEEVEGPASYENYEVFAVQVRYISVMAANQQWSRDAQTRLELVRDKLSRNQAVFAIGSQRQLNTPETVEVGSFGFTNIGDQTVWQGILQLRVEARRWG